MMGSSPFAGKSVIIMDFDGTIADTDAVHLRAFQLALKGLCASFDYSKYAGWSTEDVIRDVLGVAHGQADDTEVRRLVRLKQDHALTALRKGPIFIAGAESFILRAHSRGYRLALASGASRERLGAAMSHPSLRGKFEAVVTAEDVANGKPAPLVYREVLLRMGIAADKAIAIEDSYSGVMSAVRADLDVLCINEHCNLGDNCRTAEVMIMNYADAEDGL